VKGIKGSGCTLVNAFRADAYVFRSRRTRHLVDAAHRLVELVALEHVGFESGRGLEPAGTAMGGARPKAVVEDREALWIAKFNRRDDKWNQARVEHAMLALARECGLSVAQSRLTQIADRDALLVKRFDREHSDKGYRRARMLSALTLLRTEDSHLDRDC